MEVFKQELHVFPLRAYLDATREAIGDEALARLLQRYGLSIAHFEDANAWISVEFAEAFLEDMVNACNDPDHLDRATRRGMSRKYLGPLLPLFVAFGSPLFAFQQHSRAAAQFNKAGTWRFVEGRPGFARMSFRAPPGIRERGLLCKTREIQEGLVPALFGFAPGVVRHPRCMVRGDDECVYDITWRQDAQRHDGAIGFGLGIASGATFAHFTPLGSLAAAIVVLTLGIGGWALGKLRVARADLKRRSEDVFEHNSALAQLTRAHEQRYQELLEAKTAVDEKVAQRTEELRGASQKLSDALSQLQDLDRAKTDFFNNVSHELRSPLTLILAPLEDLVAGRLLLGDARATFGAMQRNAERLLHLINQLLDLAKIDAGAMTISPAPVQLTSLVRGIAAGFEPVATKKGVRFTLTAPEALGQVVLDASWIETAVTNLVANALRMTDLGGGVRIAIEDHGAEVAISVADDGPGIAPQDHAKVFERFAQGDSNKRMVGGTGLGLVLVREAARLHGGDVTLLSDFGKGATFTLRLPRKPAGVVSIAPHGSAPRPLTVPPRASATLAPELSTADRAGPAPAAPLALVVEDNPELLHFIADVLSVRYRVRAVGNGREALALVPELKPDVVVSDVAMGSMDGYELCRALRNMDETRTLPVLLVTARTDISSVLTGFEAGANDYVLKPFHGRELLARVDVHVRVRRMVQELALQERHAMLGVLAASVAHQVRNPLTSLVSGLPAMRRRIGPKIDSSSLELMDVMVECAERIERLTQDLLDLSRVDREEGGKYRPSDGLRAALRLFRTRASEGVNIEDDVETSAMIDGRVGDMNHVFMNLLDNALRALGPIGAIRVRGTTENDYYVVRIEDSGPGIDAETAQRIFEPFFTTREAGEGTGLGLAIARQVVTAAGGTIEVGRSALGGALFTTRIPMAKGTAQQLAARPQ